MWLAHKTAVNPLGGGESLNHSPHCFCQFFVVWMHGVV
jgi:hypothetical protein